MISSDTYTPTPPDRSLRAILLIALPPFILVSTLLIQIALTDDHAWRESLAFMLPLDNFIRFSIPWFLPIWSPWLEISIAVLVLFLGVRSKPQKISSFTLIFSIAFASLIAGQSALIHKHRLLGVVCYLIGIVCLWKSFSSAPETAPLPSPRHSLIKEAFLVFTVMCLAAAFRLYALNALPPGWDDELAIFIAFTTTGDGTIRLGLGAMDPIGSPGFLWHLGHFFALKIFGMQIMSERITGVLLGLASILVQYIVSRQVFGRFAALTTLALVSFNTLEFEWSRLPNWHHLPGLFITILFWQTWKYLKSPTLLRTGIIIALIVLSSLLYPSGLLPGLMPIFVMGVYFFNNRKTSRSWIPLLICTIFGFPLWRLSKSLIYFFWFGEWKWFHLSGTHLPGLGQLPVQDSNFTTTITTWWEALSQSTLRFFDFLFVQAIDPTHWAPLFGSAMPRTAIPSIVAIFSTIGLVTLLRTERSSPRSCVLLCWLPLSVAAAFYSNEIDSRRFGTLFPALTLLASHGAAIIYLWAKQIFNNKTVARIIIASSIGITTLFLSLTEFQIYFSMGRQFPPERAMAETLKPLLKEGTLVAIDSHPFREWKMFCLLLNNLTASNGTIGWYSFDGFPLEHLLKNPRPNVDNLPYLHTILRETVPVVLQRQNWSQLLLVTDTRTTGPQQVHDAIMQRWPKAEISTHEIPGPIFPESMKIYRIDLGHG